MKAIDLYRFIIDNDIEWRHEWNSEDKKDDVIVFIYTFQVVDFHKILPNGLLGDGGIKCHVTDNYFCFWMDDICAYCDIELNEVFKSNPNSHLT